MKQVEFYTGKVADVKLVGDKLTNSKDGSKKCASIEHVPAVQSEELASYAEKQARGHVGGAAYCYYIGNFSLKSNIIVYKLNNSSI